MYIFFFINKVSMFFLQGNIMYYNACSQNCTNIKLHTTRFGWIKNIIIYILSYRRKTGKDLKRSSSESNQGSTHDLGVIVDLPKTMHCSCVRSGFTNPSHSFVGNTISQGTLPPMEMGALLWYVYI